MTLRGERQGQGVLIEKNLAGSVQPQTGYAEVK
jgi:hypothetical protein